MFDVRVRHEHEFIYVLVFEHDIVKIGRSGDVSNRVHQLTSICSLELEEGFLYGVLDAGKAERELLAYWQEFRINDGEWFYIPKEQRGDFEQQGESIKIGYQTFWPHCARCEKCSLCERIREL